MIELGWATAIQALIIAASTWYVRKGSHEDAQKVVNGTAAQSTSNEILNRVTALEQRCARIEKATCQECGIDDRGPRRQS